MMSEEYTQYSCSSDEADPAPRMEVSSQSGMEAMESIWYCDIVIIFAKLSSSSSSSLVELSTALILIISTHPHPHPHSPPPPG